MSDGTPSLDLPRAARQWGGHPAVADGDGAISYGRLPGLVTAMATRLGAEGADSGRPLVLAAANSTALVITLLAAWHRGIAVLPLNPRFPAAQRHRIVNDLGDTVYWDSPPLDRWLKEAEGRVDTQPPLPVPDPATPATLVLTSGSSGDPKPALHSLANHLWSAAGSNINIPLVPGDRWLLALPLFHVGGLAILFRCLLAGATIAVAEPDLPLPEAIEANRPSHLSLVATQLQRLMDGNLPPEALEAVKAVLLGGSAIPDGLLRAAFARSLPVHTSYGSTEMGSQITATPTGADLETLRGSGRVLPHREVRIAPDGEILVRGKTLFLGYRRGTELDGARDEAGWFHTRDRGYLDAAGHLHVTGRFDNMFISGGENIQPEAIERALAAMEGIRNVVVVPVLDPEFGQRPAAFVAAGEAGEWRPEFWRESLARTLPRFMLPVALFPWPADIPERGIKPDRGALARRAAELWRAGR